LNEERLDYEIHVLRKHEEEVVLVKSEQKRKITSLQVPAVIQMAKGVERMDRAPVENEFLYTTQIKCSSLKAT
jgi:hypothetical protein